MPNVFEGYYTFQNDCECSAVNNHFGCSHYIRQHLGENNNLNTIDGATQRGGYAAEHQKAKDKKHTYINSKKKYIYKNKCMCREKGGS